jgi:hypothetical protein
MSLDNTRVAPISGMPVDDHPWGGILRRKPWEWPATLAIVHRDTPELLAGVVSLWRAQTVRPYLLIVDTGSGPAGQAVCEQLHAADDCEVHYLRAKGWRGSSHVVGAAMDLAFSVCQTEVLLASHTDVFPTKPDLAEHLVKLCDARTPVVAWQMSPRDEWPDDCWRETPSHTASAYHLPTLRAMPASWSLIGAQEAAGLPTVQTTGGFPDTETRLGQLLARHGITRRDLGQPDDGGRHWLCLGTEPNEPYETPWFRHVRSTTSMQLYFPRAPIRPRLVARELAAIPQRLQSWGVLTPCLTESR